MRYFDICDHRASSLTREQARRVYLSVFNVLTETICDDLIAKCWRGWCLDNIGKPLSRLRYLSEGQKETKEIAALESQMRLLSSYFLR